MINIKILPFAVAASASSPKNRPTQTALIEPFNDCNADDPRVGKENSSMILAIDPLVRSRLLSVVISVSLKVHPFVPSKLAFSGFGWLGLIVKTLIINDNAYIILIRKVKLFLSFLSKVGLYSSSITANFKRLQNCDADQ